MRIFVVALIVGVLCSLGMLKTGFQPFAEGYFYGALLAASVAVGALGVRLIHALTGGVWGDQLKRYYLPTSRTVPAALLLFVPVLFWLHRLYVWAQPAAVAADPLLQHKAAYLNAPFFIVRFVIYFILWAGAAWWLDRRKTDISGLLTVLYALAGTFAAMDWVMSLLPHWYSTIFAITFLSGQVLFAFAFLLLVNGIDRRPDAGLPGKAPRRHIDLGSLLLTMVMFWAYLAFSQLLIIWMGNKPDEISWYLAHLRYGWGGMPAAIILGHFFLPFFLLLRQSWKASSVFLAAVAGIVILMRAADIAWMVFSGLARSVASLTLTHLGAVLVVVSLYLVLWLFQARRVEEAS